MSDLDILLALTLDQAALEKVKGGFSTVDKELNRIIVDGTKAQATLQSIGQAAQGLGQLSKTAFLSGVGLLGSMYALANRYAKTTKEATDTTREWNNQTERLQKSSERVMEVLAREALPTLTKIADIAEKIADFAERNPQIAKLAVNTGFLLTAAGAIGMIASQGVQFATGVLNLVQASKTLLAYSASMAASSAAGNLGAGGASVLASGAGTLTASGVAATASAIIPAIIATLAVVAAGAIIGTAVYEKFVRKVTGGPSLGQIAGGAAYLTGTAIGKVSTKLGLTDEKEAERKTLVFTALIAKWTGAIDEGSGLYKAAVASIKNTNTELKSTISNADLSKLKEMVGGFQNAQIETVRKAEQQKQDIIRNSANAQVDIMRNLARQISSIQRNYTDQVKSITDNFNRNEVQAEQQYKESRMSIIESAGQAAIDAEKRLQQDLERLRSEHQDRVDELVDERDALGLVKEKRRYDKERDEKVKAANEEINEMKAESKRRLQELDNQYRRERIQRNQAFQQQLKDAKEQKDKEIREAKIAAAQAAEDERINKERQLRELRIQTQRELDERRRNFQQQLNDLGNFLTSDAKLRQKYYSTMLSEVDKLVSNLQSRFEGNGLGSGTAVGGYAAGGYVRRDGKYRMAEGNMEEYVLNNRTTKAIEARLGEKITDTSLLRSLTGGDVMNYIDQRNIASEVSPVTRRLIREETQQALAEYFGGRNR